MLVIFRVELTQIPDWEYTKDYRNCKRVLTKSDKFAKEIWNRILPKLVRFDTQFKVA